MNFVGRAIEGQELESRYKQKESQLVVIYGRRRVGKSTLVDQFLKNKPALQLEGLEGVATKGQLEHVTQDLIQQINEPLLKISKFNTWSQVFTYMTDYLNQQASHPNKKKVKQIIFMDELQWLAANQSKLVSLIKFYWDRYWSKQNIMLILCGSVSSYMIGRVIKSKALYGRINWELCLQPFAPNEIYELLDKKRSKDEIMLYSMLLGGIPKYLNELDINRSLDQNINKLFFVKNAIFLNEYERIFFSQFKEHRTYELIVQVLKDTPRSLTEVSKMVKIPSGGGLKRYLDNLEKAAFISSYTPYDKELNSKLIRYKLTDEYLRFYFKYVAPNLKLIQNNLRKNLFSQVVKPVWQSWLCFAFENFCIKNAAYLAEIMGFSEQLLHWGPLFQKSDTQFQVDLIYVRQDKVITLCEIKYHSQPIGVSIVKEVERKCTLITIPRGYTLEKALISRFGPDDSLRELGYFHHHVQIDNFFQN